jgi:hypothetical protein
MFISFSFDWFALFKSGEKIIFLVPTVPLANQQGKVFEKELRTKVFTSDNSSGIGTKAGFDQKVAGYEVSHGLYYSFCFCSCRLLPIKK